MKKTFNIIFRILGYPFILGLILTIAFRDSLLFVFYGGETFLYKKNDRKLISDIYEELKSQRK